MSLNHWLFKYCAYSTVTFIRGEYWWRHLSNLQESQWHSRSEIEMLQQRKLEGLLKNIIEIPFFQEYADPIAALSDRSISNLLSTLPLMSKADLISHHARLSNPSITRVTVKTTGGSTGQAVTLAKSREATAQEIAGQWRGFSWAGLDLGYRQGRFWGVPKTTKARWTAKLADFLANRRRCSAFSFSERDMNDYAAHMRAFQPDYLYGYVSMIAAFAEHLANSGETIGDELKAVITTAELLTDTDRAKIEKGTGAKVFNEYGCGELGTVAHECESGSLHLNAENMIVEIVGDNGQPVPDGEVGEIVVTELNNLAMPLVRYRLGDYGAIQRKPCACGRGLPVLEEVVGRAYDTVRNKHGELFHGEFFMYIFEDVKRRGLGIKQFQVEQQDLDAFLIRVVPGETYSAETEDFVRSELQKGFGEDLSVTFEPVEKIERLKSGKMRLIIGLSQPK